MIQLDQLEGIAGVRWGARVARQGEVLFFGSYPENSRKKLELVGRLLPQLSFNIAGADLYFDRGRILLRCGMGEMLVLFCDLAIKASLVDIVLENFLQVHSQAESSRADAAGNSSFSQTDSVIRSIPDGVTSEKLLGPEPVEALLELFTRQLGPLARLFAKKEAARLGLGFDGLKASDWNVLTNALAAKIDNAEKREWFLDQAVLLKLTF